MVMVSQQSDDDFAPLLREAAEQLTDHAIILMDTAGRITWWSPGAEQIFGYKAVDVLGQQLSKIFTSDDLQLGIDQLEFAVASESGISENDRWHVRADGARFWSIGSLLALRSPSGKLLGFYKILRNRTDWKEQVESWRSYSEQAREDIEHTRTGTATLAHELRNLLFSLKHGLQIARQDPDAVRRERLFDSLGEQLEVLHRLTEDLVDVARVGAGKIQLQREVVELRELLRSVLRTKESHAQAKRIAMQLLAPGGHVTTLADPSRLRQVFGNLIDNAIKYTPADGQVWVKLTVEGHEAVVHVEDTGIGIPAERLTDIFELFTQVPTEAAAEGMGIGLAVVRDLVKLHGGTVLAVSDGANKGSKFTVRLPRYEQSEEMQKP